jgi:hypothetical protein
MVRNTHNAIQRSLQLSWETIWQIAVWVASIVFLAISAPPRFLGSELPPSGIIKTIELVLAISIGFCLFLFRNSNPELPKHRYAFAAIGFLVLAVVLFLINQYQFDTWTCSYDERGPVTIGTNLEPDAGKYVADHPEANCQYLLQISAGRPDKIWKTSEIVFHHLAMIMTSLASVLAFALAILLITFAVSDNVARHK